MVDNRVAHMQVRHNTHSPAVSQAVTHFLLLFGSTRQATKDRHTLCLSLGLGLGLSLYIYIKYIYAFTLFSCLNILKEKKQLVVKAKFLLKITLSENPKLYRCTVKTNKCTK